MGLAKMKPEFDDSKQGLMAQGSLTSSEQLQKLMQCW
jgi:hypothetical protein